MFFLYVNNCTGAWFGAERIRATLQPSNLSNVARADAIGAQRGRKGLSNARYPVKVAEFNFDFKGNNEYVTQFIWSTDVLYLTHLFEVRFHHAASAFDHAAGRYDDKLNV